MKSAETITLVPEPTKPATILAKVVDESGRPATPAVMHLTPWKYANWIMDERPEATKHGGESKGGERVNADVQGCCRLEGVMPGRLSVTIEAKGCEVVIRQVDISPGQVIDLGEVKCRAASGSIVIRLKNMRDGVSYYCWLWTPPPDSPHMTVEHVGPSPVITIGRLPLRKYKVSVAAGNGGPATVIEAVELTADSPGFETELDVGDLVPGEDPASRKSGGK